MLFAHTFDSPTLLRRIRYFRQRPFRLYAVALLLVAAATCARLALHPALSTTAPFTTHTLAVTFMAFAGGFWPGIATLVASLVAGSILFLPPAFSLELAEGAEWTLLMFAAIGTINVVLISGLMARILLHDEQQQFLFKELQHRSRNLFAVIQGIASRTLAQSQSLREAKSALETRLTSLARTHAMLADSGWAGASLDYILSEELTSFARQVSCIGCDVILATPAAQNFALIIHELTTNAVKHGALSCAQGRVAVEGWTDQTNGKELFRFRWTETGGPTVKPPQRKGFGSSILNGLATRFAQTVEVTYRPEGLMYELQMPLRSIEPSESNLIERRMRPTEPSRNAPSPEAAAFRSAAAAAHS